MVGHPLMLIVGTPWIWRVGHTDSNRLSSLPILSKRGARYEVRIDSLREFMDGI